jgi:hypothetical protein
VAPYLGTLPRGQHLTSGARKPPPAGRAPSRARPPPR